MKARGGATIGVAICAVAAAVTGARAAMTWGGRPGEAAAPPRNDAAIAEARTRVSAALATRTHPLEAEVARGAEIPELKAALNQQVDGPTILDLFDTEDWWAPFRARAVAIAVGDHLLAVRGDKTLPFPAGLIARAAQSGVAAGVLAGGHPLVAAVAPIALLHADERTWLVLAAPLDVEALAREIGGPIALSDGHRVVVSTGDEAQKAAFVRVIGQETAGSAPTDGALAIAVPTSANLWLWTLSRAPAPVATPAPLSGDPRLWLGLAGLFAVGAAFFARSRGRGPGAAASSAQTPAGFETVRSSARTTALSPPEDSVPSVPGGTAYLPNVDPAAAEAPRSTMRMGTRPTPTGSNTFGRYRLLRRMDGGGMADIYAAALHGAEGFRRVFVIKRLRPELARIRTAVEQFIDEARLGSQLTHPNIVPVLDFGKVGDEYFMAQEYVVGRDIGRLLQRHFERTGKPLGERLMLYIAHDVLDALAFVHTATDTSGKSLGIVHRDISPGNIMVTARGEVKLFDFGIVKADTRVSKTEAGVVKGNVGFMSPEQARGQAVDPRSDLFSLGLVIYYGLLNEQIYPGGGTFEQLLEAASGPTPEQMAKTDALPLTSPILRRALAVDPAARYQTAGEFAADLAPFISGARAEAAALMQQLFGDELRLPATD